MPVSALYPDTKAQRDRWILDRRGPRNAVDPMRPYAFFLEEERSARGDAWPTATILVTNRECPWHCVMCDLWQDTLQAPSPGGAIAAQIAYALERLAPVRQVKLYNSGSFFDMRAIAPAEYAAVARLLHGMDRVIVESHPALVGERTWQFRDMLQCPLEVAMGLETVHAETLAKLNKGVTLQSFWNTAKRLAAQGVSLRAFIMVQPPFQPVQEAVMWAQRSLDFAFDCGATAATLIPARMGNGAMEALHAQEMFTPPDLSKLEACLEYGIALQRGRVFVDTWGKEQLQACSDCNAERWDRLETMMHGQVLLPKLHCTACGG